MHEAARNFIEAKAAELGPFNEVLEIGSRNINGTVRDFFPDTDYFGVDVVNGPDVDAVLDAVSWNTTQRFDCIVCCEVFEHEPRWPLLIGKIATWLRDGGVALITCAGPGRAPHSTVDGGPIRAGEPYENVDPFDLARIAAVHRLDAELDESVPGDLYAVLRKS